MNNVLNKIVLILYAFFTVNHIYSQESTKLLAELDYFDFENLNIVEKDFVFDGYLIIEFSQFIDRSIFIEEDNVYYCNIFCVKNINDIVFPNKRFIFLKGYFLFDNQNLRKKKIPLEIQKFFEERYNDVIYDTTKCDSMDSRLTTALLSRDHFFTYLYEKTKGYFIFKVSFRSALIKSDLYYPKYSYTNNEYIKTGKLGSISSALVILQREKCLNLFKQDEEDVKNFCFSLSSWYPDFLK